MTDPRPTSDTAIPFTVLDPFLTNEFRRRLVGRAISHRLRASPELRRPLDEAIRASVRVTAGGFRDALKAPPATLASATVTSFGNSADLVRSILAVWIDSHPALRDTVAAHLKAGGTQVVPFASLQSGFTSEHMIDGIVTEAEAVRAGNEALDVDDVALMLCCLAGWAPAVDTTPDVR